MQASRQRTQPKENGETTEGVWYTEESTDRGHAETFNQQLMGEARINQNRAKEICGKIRAEIQKKPSKKEQQQKQLALEDIAKEASKDDPDETDGPGTPKRGTGVLKRPAGAKAQAHMTEKRLKEQQEAESAKFDEQNTAINEALKTALNQVRQKEVALAEMVEKVNAMVTDSDHSGALQKIYQDKVDKLEIENKELTE